MKERLNNSDYFLTNLSVVESFKSVKRRKCSKTLWADMLKFLLVFTIKNYVGPVAQLVRAVDS